MEKELRYIENSEIRAAEDSRDVDGYAIVFNTLSRNLGGFYERIEPGATDGVIEASDIMALLNHDNSRGILARSRFGVCSLTLSADEKGLKYSFSAPKTALGDECLEMLRRGDITQSSFAFTVAEDSWAKQEDGTYIRTIKKFDRLYDVSPVYEPAYFGTDVKCRSFEDFKAEEERKEQEAKAEQERLEQEQREAEEKEKEEKLAEYYQNMRAEYEEALKKGEELNATTK
jgi:HK97 family phage prohead protease